MDSLLATYASSDEEDDRQQSQNQSPAQNQPIQSKFGGNFSTLPPPKLKPRSDSSPSQLLFSKLPLPKSERSDPFSVSPRPKKVVQFRPPVTNKVIEEDDDDDDDYDADAKKQTKKDDHAPHAPSVKSFLSSIPAPRNSGSLGALPSSSGTGRRSILEAEVTGLSNSNVNKVSGNKIDDNLNDNKNVENQFESVNAQATTSADYASYDYNSTYGGYQNVESTDYSTYGPAPTSADYANYGPAAPTSVDYENYGGYEGYSGNENYGQYESKWIDRSGGNVEPVIPEVRSHGKRGRNQIPEEVIEVSQDELMKNRPREDQVKMTGIAFGPSYQPVSSAKGKPSKLHKRKHQIGTLYFDMKSKESELAERRSRGFLTKAETHAKYGW